jgi:anti-sigma B factor antagonist
VILYGIINWSGDPKVLPRVQDNMPNRLRVVKTGRHCIFGFDAVDWPPEHVVSQYLDQITALIRESDCSELSFDMKEMRSVPSGFLGLIASIRKQGVQVSLQNACREVREVLALANLDRFIQVRETD